MKSTKTLTVLLLAFVLLAWQPEISNAKPMGTAWTYQGRLIDTNKPADGMYDFQFKLFDEANTVTGNQRGSTVDINDLDLIDGYFTAELDFGSSVFDGNAVWLEISVRPGDSNDSFTTLSLRQELTPSPYSRYAAVAGSTVGGIEGSGTADNLAKFTGSSTVGNSVIYEVDDKIGIGTQNTQAKLSVQMPSGPPLSIIDVDGLVIRDGWWNNGDHLVVQDVAGDPQLVIRGPRIGIGTASPEVSLHLKGPGWPNSFVYLQGDTGYDAGIRLYEGNIDKWHIFNSTSDDGLRIYNSNGLQTVFFADQNTGNVGVGTTNPVNKLDVEGGLAVGANYSGSSAAPVDGMIVEGGIGIGTDSPDEKLHVKGSGFVQANFESDSSSGGVKLTASGGQAYELQSLDDGGFIIYDRTDEQYRVNIDTAGNVGIGTTAPSEKLDVAGNIDVSNGRVKHYRGFPRPDYDSGWVPVTSGEFLLLHYLGGDVDNYVVDLTFKYMGSIQNVYYGGYVDSSGNFIGTTWRDLTTYSITVFSGDILWNDEVRVRIWVYD